jgi:hypothetical protein
MSNYNIQNINNFLACVVLIVFCLQPLFTIKAQNSNNYSMPFPSDESWRTNDFQGVHTSALGFAIDLIPPDNSNNNILAMSDGVLSRVCTADNVTVLRLLTNNNDNFRFAFLDANTVPVKENQELIVKKGDNIGQLANPGVYKRDKCNLTFPIKMLMLSWEKNKCNLEIQNYKFTCENMKKCNDFADCNYTSTNQYYTSNITETINNQTCDILLKSKYIIGESGIKISKLQQCLKDIGLYNYVNGITGYFGSYTLGQISKYNEVTPSKKELTDCEKVLIDYYIQGDSGEKISQFQECLKQKSYFNYPAGITGYFGEYTKTAYNNFLNSYGDICSLLKQASYNQGEISPRVKRLQQCMRDAKVFDFPSNTGYFGIITQASLKVWKSS